MSVDMSAVDDGLGNTIAGAVNASPSTALAALTAIMAATDRNAGYPYLTIGEYETINGNVACSDQVSVVYPVHIWTREAGFDQCKKIDAALLDLFDDSPFTVVGHAVTGCYHRRSRFMRDPERGIRHGVTEFLIHVEKTS